MTAERANFGDYFLALLRHFDHEQVAIKPVDSEESPLKYGEMEKRVVEFERKLSEAGVQAGDRMVIVGPNSAAFLLVSLAVWRLRGVLIPLNSSYKQYELREYLGRARPAVVLVDERLDGKFELPDGQAGGLVFFSADGLRMSRQPTEHTAQTDGTSVEDAILFFSSGTTGPPKLAALTHGALCAHLDVAATARLSTIMPRLGKEDVCLSVLPFFHAGGLLTAFVMLASGVRLLLWERIDRERLVAVVVDERVTVLSVVPALFPLLLAFPAAVWAGVCFVFVGGDRVDGAIRKKLQERMENTKIVQLYGTTEAGTLVFMQPTEVDEKHADSCGLPLPGVQIRVTPDGELLLKTTTIFRGYDGDLGQTRQVSLNAPHPVFLREAFDENGWLKTGDLVVVDEDKWVTIVGRSKEMIKIRGWQIAPQELEEAIERQFPSILSSCIFEHESSLVGLVHVKEGEAVDEQAIVDHVKANFVSYKHLKAVRTTTEEFPRTAAGKLKRWELQERFSNNFSAKST